MTPLDRCPGCAAPTAPRITADGYRHASFCLPCTEAELGESYEQIRDRVTALVHRGGRRKWSIFTGPREQGRRR